MFLEIINLIWNAFLKLLISPIFWIVVFFIGFQYKKVYARSNNNNYANESFVKQTLLSTFYGIIGGIIGSFLMIIVGISISDIGIGFLWIVAIILMLINIRFLCFAYAGTVISISYLLFGWPQVEVAQLMGLVAVLHLIESLLIFVNGHHGVVPVYVKNYYGQTVGALSMQKFWPIPIVTLMIFESMQLGSTGEGVIDMPKWWPVIKSLKAAEIDNIIYVMFPVMAGLGYGDISISTNPRIKAKQSAGILSMYSLTLLFLSVAASRFPQFSILPAVFGALGHELTIWIGKKTQLEGKPFYVNDGDGVKVLYVANNSPADKNDIKSGYTILKINDINITNRFQFQDILNYADNLLKIEYIDLNGNKNIKDISLKNGEVLGIIPVPETYDSPQVSLSTRGLLWNFIKKNKT